MRKELIHSLTIIGYLFLLLFAHSQAKAETSEFGLNIALANKSNTYQIQSQDHQAKTSLILTPTYTINADWSLALSVGGSQEHTHATKSEVENMDLELIHSPILLSRDLDFSYSLSSTLALNEDDKRYTSYLGSVGAEAILTLHKSFLKNPLNLFSSLSGSHNFHEFERTAFDEPNTQQSGGLKIGAAQSLLKNFLLSLSAGLIVAQTYQGVIHNFYAHSQKLSYITDNKKTKVYIGHSNEGDTLKADGSGQQFDLFSEQRSSFLAGVSHTF